MKGSILKLNLDIVSPYIPYAKRILKANLDKKLEKFLEILKNIHVNIPLIDALKQMPSYAMFLKEDLQEEYEEVPNFVDTGQDVKSKLQKEEVEEELRALEVRQHLPGKVVRRLHSTKEIEADTSKISQDLREIQKTVQDYGHRLSNIPMKVDSLCHQMDQILKILPDLHKNLTDLKTEVANLKRNQRETLKRPYPDKSASGTPLGQYLFYIREGRADISDLQELAESFSQLGIVELVNVQTNEVTPALLPPEGSICSNEAPHDHPMRESADFHTNATPTEADRRMVAAINIAATTLELDKENFIKLVELSLEGSMKIGRDNTPADTKASILAGDSKSAIADRLERLIKIHFIGDGYFKGSRAEKAR
ncbi:hypothetical protein Sango_2423800 [Sesamum angolense]|uniref:Uncharacterized protein n=1 Tax=Sesamum angolense TaxID=2727404 RepID=A0AAE2BJY5_9LAMI|nr:hypothetical protein Sango_2423800 [Sesamum angolense]